jgi:hypothetical protein
MIMTLSSCSSRFSHGHQVGILLPVTYLIDCQTSAVLDLLNVTNSSRGYRLPGRLQSPYESLMTDITVICQCRLEAGFPMNYPDTLLDSIILSTHVPSVLRSLRPL